MISAYAGTAKSTTLQFAAPGISSPALALAFNKKIADELRPRLPPNFTTKTLNGLGHSAWARTIPSQSIKLDDRKLGKLVTQVARERKSKLTPAEWDEARSLVTSAQLAGISPFDEGQPLLPDTRENWNFIAETIPSDEIYEVARRTLIESNLLAALGTISFDDQIYCPTVLGGSWPLFPTVFIDESQDLSPLNHKMLSLCCNGRIVAVGDPKQAIYAFRGADANSMLSMRHLSPDWKDLALTMTFRCPRLIVERQQEHAPGYTAAPSCVDGRFVTHETFHHFEDEEVYWNWSDVTDEAAGFNLSSIAILCRNNAPLLSLALKLLRRGIGCQMLGRDIGRGLLNLTKKILPSDPLPIARCYLVIEAWKNDQISLALAQDRPDRADRATDRAECLVAIAEGSGASTAGDLRAAIEKIFAATSSKVILSSIHRAKGLEFDLVLHLDPWRIPSKFAKTPTELEQEANLRYVAETRTKHTLLNLNLRDFQ